MLPRPQRPDPAATDTASVVQYCRTEPRRARLQLRTAAEVASCAAAFIRGPSPRRPAVRPAPASPAAMPVAARAPSSASTGGARPALSRTAIRGDSVFTARDRHIACATAEARILRGRLVAASESHETRQWIPLAPRRSIGHTATSAGEPCSLPHATGYGSGFTVRCARPDTPGGCASESASPNGGNAPPTGDGFTGECDSDSANAGAGTLAKPLAHARQPRHRHGAERDRWPPHRARHARRAAPKSRVRVLISTLAARAA